VKDLRKPIEHLKHPDQENPDRPAHRFDERTTLLLDDSPRKAAFQPWSQIVVPEYDKAEYQSSKAAALHFEEDGFADRSGMDEILLGVVGLLEELRSVENVPAWVRAGGLTRQKDVAKIGVEVQSAGAEWITAEEPTLHRLPSHESFSHWYQTPAVLHYWTERGRQALIRKGIEINSGIDVNSLDSPAPLPRFIPPYMNHASSPSEINNFSRALKNAPKPRPRQRWSPSRPASAEPEDQNEPSPILKGQSPLPQQVRRPYSTATLIHEADFSAAALASVHIDQWRTFRAVDVSRYLADVADRPSPLDEQRRALLLQAVEVLQSLAPDSTFDDPSPSAKLAEQGFFPNMCDTCTLTAGHGATKRRNEGVRAAATVIGLMADKVTAPPGKAKKVPRKIAKAKRGPTSGKIKKGPTKRLPGKAKKTAAPGTNQQPISRDPTWGKPTMSGQIVPTTQPLVGQQAVRSKETTLEAATSARGDQKVAVFAPSPESQNSTQLEPHKVDLPFEFLEPSLRLKYQGLAMEVRRLQVNLDTDTRLATRMAQQGKQVPSYNGVLTNNTAKRQNRENHLASTLARLPEPVRDSLLRGDLPTSTSDGAPFGTSTAQMSSGVSTIQSSSASESLGMKPSRHLKASKCNREASACVCRWEAEVGGNKAGPSNVNGADSEQMDLPQQGVWKSLPRGAKNRGRVAMHETVNKLGTFDDGDEFKTKPGPSLRTRSRSLAESVSTGEKQRRDAMASQAEERELADDEVAEILFPWPDIPVAGEVEE